MRSLDTEMRAFLMGMGAGLVLAGAIGVCGAVILALVTL